MKEITTEKTILTENNPLLQQYFKDISKYPIYSPSEQIQLAKEAKEGNELSRQKLINSNLRFVVTCAKKYAGQGVPLIDLIGCGNLGVIQAIENFDPDKGFHFISFAVWYIRREIVKAIYNTGRTIRYPITYISKITKVQKLYNNFISDNERIPTDEELFELTGLSRKQFDSVMNNKSYCQSIDTPISDDNKTTIESIIPEEVDPFKDFSVKDAISKSLKTLTDREYKVITEFYGLEGNSERAIKEIAKELNLGDERVRQIRKTAIKKLNKKCGNFLKTLL